MVVVFVVVVVVVAVAVIDGQIDVYLVVAVLAILVIHWCSNVDVVYGIWMMVLGTVHETCYCYLQP